MKNASSFFVHSRSMEKELLSGVRSGLLRPSKQLKKFRIEVFSIRKVWVIAVYFGL